MPAQWRLIIDDPLDGAWNMAVDRAIQVAREQGRVPATLRLYMWSKPTVTLGRFQDASSIDWTACRDLGVSVVRRFTGGRGVFHDDEVTYSLIASESDGVPSGISASYRYLCQGLVAAYRRLGVDAGLTERPKGSAGSAACYLRATRADLTVGSAKLAGSAQTWLGKTCLQHGSFTVTRDVVRESDVFHLSADERQALSETTVTLQDLLDDVPVRDRIVHEVAAGIGEGLGIEFKAGKLTVKESQHAESLLAGVSVETPSEDRVSDSGGRVNVEV